MVPNAVKMQNVQALYVHKQRSSQKQKISEDEAKDDALAWASVSSPH